MALFTPFLVNSGIDEPQKGEARMNIHDFAFFVSNCAEGGDDIGINYSS